MIQPDVSTKRGILEAARQAAFDKRQKIRMGWLKCSCFSKVVVRQCPLRARLCENAV